MSQPTDPAAPGADATSAALVVSRQEASELRARLAAVLEALPDLWFVFDERGTYLESNSPDHPTLIRPFHEIRGRTLAEVLPEEPARLRLAGIAAALATGRTQRFEYQLLDQGRTHVFEARVSPLPGRRALFMSRDITAHRTAEQSLAASEERWKFALESVGHGVWDWDDGDAAVYFSPSWKAIVGHAEDEIAADVNEWFHRIHPADLADAKAALYDHLRGRTALYAVEHRMRHRDGHDVWVLNRGKVVRRSPAGRATRMVGTMIDVTAQHDAEEALRARQAAELASRAKSEFLSRMSHEMRTPLNAVMGFTQLLLNRPGDPDPGQVRDYAAHVLRAGEHLLALINDVLDLQRVEEGRLALTLSQVPLDAAVARVVELLEPDAHQRGVRIDNAVPPGVVVHADDRHLRQVLLNIASNAVKYNRPAGLVRLSVAADAPSGRVRLAIEDTGAGLAPAQLERLFQPFERLGRETSTIEGTGLGLIIARSLTQAMGGHLEVTSRAGQGTCMVMELAQAPPAAPTAAMPAPAGPADSAPAAVGERPPLRVLYVEDNRVNAILFQEALRMHQAVELRLAEDGADALEQVQDWQPDVLVLDAHLPGMDGFQLLEALRRQTGLAEVPAFMCSADAMPDDVKRAADAGFAGYWAKPINVVEIMGDLDRVAEARRTSDAP